MKARLFTDTTEFFSIDRGDVILIEGKRYEILGHERERRFGIEDPKFWVKRAMDMETGERRIIKLSHFESFFTTLGGVKIRCFRSPQKEAEILNFVKGRPEFMQGSSHFDKAGNNIRILDIVPGPNFLVYIDSLEMDHETYFQSEFPEILIRLVEAFEAIRHLHVNGYRHGDIRNDHIIIEKSTGNYVWIDFDYDFETAENPFSLDIFGLANILVCAVGKGLHSLHDVKDREIYGDLIERLEPGDFSILDKWRFFNLKKLYPYIPEQLNDVLKHFSRSADVYYEYADEMLDDIRRFMMSLG